MTIDLTSLPKDKFLGLMDENDSSLEYYSTVYDRMSENKVVKWNWAAAIFNLMWLFYRRLYKEAILGSIACFLFMDIFSVIFPYICYKNDYIVDISFIMPLFFGFGLFGNHIYLSGLASRSMSNKKLPKGTSLLGAFFFFIVSSFLWGIMMAVITGLVILYEVANLS